jgi:CheY-like chemotaxis protein
MLNALRYTATGGVLVGTRKRGDQLLIEVWDTGIGIAPANLSRIFEEFSRINHHSPWGDRGSGLGLAICQRIVRLLGHSLTVDSKPGRGSCFRIALPLVGVQPELPAPMPLGATVASIDELPIPLNTLCVDDDPDILRSMRVLLNGWGVRVETAENGERALEIAASFAPQVLLVDQQLGLDELGVDLLKELRHRLGSKLVGCVLITADHSDSLRERCQKYGFHLLYKPTKVVRLRGLMTHFAELAAGKGNTIDPDTSASH